MMSIPIPHSNVVDRLGWGSSFSLIIKVSDLYQAFVSNSYLIQNVAWNRKLWVYPKVSLFL